MGYRLYDWSCRSCGRVREELVWAMNGRRPPASAHFDCPACNAESTKHVRLISIPAEYHGERALNPMVSGGSFDTTGHAPVTQLPDLPRGAEGNASDYSDLFASRDWRAARAQQKEDQRKNAEKRKRTAAIKRGENINMRRDKCAGDPRVTS